jgi:cell shape-determining protein MreD
MLLADFKNLLETYTGLQRDALHVHMALILYFVAMVMFRRSRRSRVPWLVVLGLEIANEVYDLWLNLGETSTDYALHGAAKDLWNTMLWPTVILLVGRYTHLFRKHGPTGEL